MLDYNLLGKGYRFSDFRNVRSSLSAQVGKAFADEYEHLYAAKYGHSLQEDMLLEKRVDDVAACIFSLIMGFRQQNFPQWAEYAKTEALNGTLLARAKELLL